MEKVKRMRVVERKQLEDVPPFVQMEKVKRMRVVKRKQLEDVPELIQHIQSLLPADEAARTCVLSKSWLRAFSTIPTLRFHRSIQTVNKQQDRNYMKFINRTLRRYHRENLPIITFDLHFCIRKQKSASRAEKWIKLVTSKTCLKELSLTILAHSASFTLPDVIFSSENLNTLSLKLAEPKNYYLHLKNRSICNNNYSLHISSNPVIECVNLRVLELFDVHISEEVLHSFLSTCKLLEKINLKIPEGFEKIKISNLRYLHELKIAPCHNNEILEIYDVPSLRTFFYNASLIMWMPVLSHTDSIGSLRELYLDRVPIDDVFSEMINSNFPFLESLTINIKSCRVEILDIRCVSLRRLQIELMQDKHIKVQVYASKLPFFRYECTTMPSFLFPTIAPELIELSMTLYDPIDHMFFLNMRETLKLSSNFDIKIKSVGSAPMVPFDIDDVRTRMPSPATNVKKLSFVTYSNEDLWEESLIIDVLFAICRPNNVEVHRPLTFTVANYLLKLLNLKDALGKNTGEVYCPHLEDGEIRNPPHGKWESLLSSSISLLDEWYYCEYKLNWCSS